MTTSESLSLTRRQWWITAGTPPPPTSRRPTPPGRAQDCLEGVAQRHIGPVAADEPNVHRTVDAGEAARTTHQSPVELGLRTVYRDPTGDHAAAKRQTEVQDRPVPARVEPAGDADETHQRAGRAGTDPFGRSESDLAELVLGHGRGRQPLGVHHHLS